MTASPPGGPEPPATRRDPAEPAQPGRDCPHCPRLVAFREENRRQYPDFWNAPVPSFGGTDARLLIVGLAPGLKGANRTGRPFTGDYAGKLLYATLPKFGLAEGAYEQRADDGFRLIDCRVTNAVRCVPPENKPGGEEIRACRSHFLIEELAALPRLKVIVALGSVAHRTVIATLGLRQNRHPFGHGNWYGLPEGRVLGDSYHCSRYNTSSGKLTPDMFEAVFAEARRRLDAAP